ncbi:DUF4097 family beta strand repeat-containing protein [Ornithinibacillus xuwenensis]|uniref:DUF4097 family beta strand repeat-containing protein n=1 Tax=Ornithinibacillus xuwenensis TaxID=3144668 RepID=A0ABU9XKM5_9BACI
MENKGFGLLNLLRKTPRETIIQEATIACTRVKNLIMSTSSAEVEVVVHEHPRVDVVLHTYEGGPELKTKHTEDTLTITAKKEEKVTFMLFGNMPKCHLQLKVPKDIAENWDIATASGKISAKQLIANRLNVHATSGAIKLSEISAEKIKSVSVSGKLTIREVKVEQLDFTVTSGSVDVHSVYGDINGEVVSGKVVMKGIKGQQLDVRAGSGRIHLQDVQMQDVDLHASSGKIEAEHLYAETIKAIVSSGKISFQDTRGDIKGHAMSGNIDLTIKENATLDLKAGSGNINLEFQEYELNSMFDIKTGSGSIVANIPMSIEHKEKRSLQGKAGEGEQTIRLRTGSGNVIMYSSKHAASKDVIVTK